MSKQPSSSAAQVAVAAALQRDAGPPSVCARLRKGVHADAVASAFERCLGTWRHSRQVSAASQPPELVLEQGPVRLVLADVYCDIDTNDPAEHEFELTGALRQLGGTGQSHEESLRLTALRQAVAEVSALYPEFSDGLEELLCRSYPRN
nr:hypothetical protein [Corynebacterium lactis]